MMHAFEPTTPSRDGNALLALTVVLILTTWSFFGRLSSLAAAAGIGTSLWLHRWYLRHPSSAAPASGRQPGTGQPAVHSTFTLITQPPMLNISAVYVGGDAAGLAFVVGCVVIFVMGLPPLRWFVVASAILAGVFAASLIAWHRTHSIWSRPEASLRA